MANENSTPDEVFYQNLADRRLVELVCLRIDKANLQDLVREQREELQALKSQLFFTLSLVGVVLSGLDSKRG